MFPVVLGIRAYPAAVAIAVVAGIALTLYRARRAGIRWRDLLIAEAVLVVAALVGGRFHALIEAGTWRPGALLALNGFRSPGALVGLLAALVFLKRRRIVPIGRLADAIAIPVAVGMATIRVGCFLHGCCYGRPTDVPWAVSFPARSPAWSEHVAAKLLAETAARSLPVHPLQLYFGVWSIAVALVLAWRQRGARYDGELFLLFLALHEGGKAALESLRAPAPLWHLQWPALFLAAIGTVALALGAARARRRRLPDPPQPPQLHVEPAT
jgi:phosphatidylglycerol---prolipoprotein diacylglyceryl transferase